jgi:plastocyanin
MLRRTLLLAITGLLLVACSGSAPTTAPSIPPNTPRISANSLAFETSSVNVPAGVGFSLAFENKEGVPHNVTILADASGGSSVFVGETFSGPATRLYQVPALSPGSHAFRCDVHPAMTGTIVAGP